MSIPLLESIESHLNSAGILAGYTVDYFRFYDDSLNSENEPFVVITTTGGGLTDPVGGVSYPDIKISVVGTVADVVSASNKAHEIRDYLVDNYMTGSVINFQLLTDVGAPIYLNNNRPMFEVNLRLTTTRMAS